VSLADLELELVDASVSVESTFLEAALRLTESGLPAIAVLDRERRVRGFFGEDEFLRGLFPRYLGELRHTAFTRDDIVALADHLENVAGQPVEQHLRKPIVVAADSSATHVAELLLHSDVTAVAVTRADRFAGMLTERDFCRALLRRCFPRR
jgi:CBS domain-containing protein